MSKIQPKTRLHVEPDLSSGAFIEISGDQAHYISRVMRLAAGDVVALFNGRDGEWLATLKSAQKKHVQFEVTEQLRTFLPPPDIWLCFAPIKFGRIDYLVQKATELGAAKLIPVMTDYTQSDRVNMKRLSANVVEAAEQCERVEVPEVGEPVALKQMLADWDHSRTLLFADESGQGQPIRTFISSTHSWGEVRRGADESNPHPNPPPSQGEGNDLKLALLIGPEGGFSETERAILHDQPFVQAVGLGPRILRADTAAIAMLSIIQSAVGDWQLAPRFKQSI